MTSEPTMEDRDQSMLVSNFGFSAVNIDELGATEYTLVAIACDISTSVASFKTQMEKCLKEVMASCRKSPRADNLMIRLVLFNSTVQEFHGFKQLEHCNPDDYDGCLRPGGMTALTDATVNSLESLYRYGKDLVDGDFDVNGILIVITDGVDNRSTNTVSQAADFVRKIEKDEVLESLVSILIGVNVQECSADLQMFKNDVGMTQYEDIGNADAKTLAKLADFISRSISAQSQALGTGGPSQSLSF